MISKDLFSTYMRIPKNFSQLIGLWAFMMVLSLGLLLPSGVLAARLDMSGEWLVKMVNADSCSVLFQSEAGGIRLSNKSLEWISSNGKFAGQSEYYLGESAYKCALGSTEPLAYINLALQLFTVSLELQDGPGDGPVLSAMQEKKLYFRRAFGEFRKLELSGPFDSRKTKAALQGVQGDLRFGGVLETEGSLGLAGKYLLGTSNSLLNRISFYEAIALGENSLIERIPSLIKESKSAYNIFSDLAGQPLVDDGVVGIEPNQFQDAVRLNRLGELVFLAQLQILGEVDSEETFQLIENYSGITGLDSIYHFLGARLNWLANGGGRGSKNLNNILDTVVADENGYADLLGVLLKIETMEFGKLFKNVKDKPVRDPRIYYWLARTQVFLGPDRVRELGVRYEPEKLLGSFLGSTRIIGNDYIRQDAIMLLQELAFENALSKGSSPRMNDLENIYSELKTFFPENQSMEKRKIVLLEILAGYGVDVLSVTWDKDTEEGMIIAFLKAASTTSSDRLSLKFLDKVQKMLDSIDTDDPDDTFGKDKKTFYVAVLEKAWSRRSSTHDEAMRHLKISIKTADSIAPASPFSAEGKYLAALSAKELCYYDGAAGVKAEAVSRLVNVVQEENNLRALYFLSGELKGGKSNKEAAEYAYMVKTVIRKSLKSKYEKNPFYRWADAIFAGYQPQNSVKVGPENGIEMSASKFAFPGAALPNGMHLEEFADKKFLQAGKTQEFLDDVSRFFPLPPLPYYSNNVFENNWFSDYSYSSVTSGIFEGAIKEMSGLKMTVQASVPFVNFDGLLLEKTAGIYEKKNIENGSYHELVVSSPGYFDYYENHYFKGFPVDKSLRYLYLAEETVYSRKAEKIAAGDFSLVSQGNKVYIENNGPENDFLKNNLGYEVRDFVKGESGNYYLCVNAKKNTIDRVPLDGKGMVQTFIKGGKDTFESPEGIAVDRDGNIYVADFAGNMVVVFNADGILQRRIGSNLESNSLKFPTRIALEEDLIGYKHGEEVFRRPSFLYVADWNGVHRFDLSGRKIDTVVKAGDGIEPGEVYGIGIVGYGPEASLIILDRHGDSAQRYKASKTN